MTYSFDGYNYLVRLERGERLGECIEQFVDATGIDGGWVSGVGGTSEVILGFYTLDTKKYQWRTFDRLMEIASLSGNLAYDEQGKMMFHLHGVFADEEYQTVGGHVKDLMAGATIELFIHRSFQPVHRKMDEAVGLQLLDLEASANAEQESK